jgi:hypothetical protein
VLRELLLRTLDPFDLGCCCPAQAEESDLALATELLTDQFARLLAGRRDHYREMLSDVVVDYLTSDAAAVDPKWLGGASDR